MSEQERKASPAQVEAARRVSDWLDDDHELRIPDSEWGRGLYDALRTLVADAVVAADKRPTCIAHECPERAVWPFLCQAHHDEAMAEEDRRLTEADEKVVAAEAEVERLRITPDDLDRMLGIDPNDPLHKVAAWAGDARRRAQEAQDRAETAEAKVAAVEALADEHDQRAIQSPARAFDGQPFPSFVTTDELRDVLSGPSGPTEATTYATGHGFTPSVNNPFADPDSCRVMLARYPCPYKREEHDPALPPVDVDVFGYRRAERSTDGQEGTR